MQRALARMGLEARDFATMAGPLGVTPKETIHASGTLKLHHYKPLVDTVYRVPVLVVTSLVNQPYILDLVPGQSMVEHLLREGFDVYLIEWGRPRREHKTRRNWWSRAATPAWSPAAARRRACGRRWSTGSRRDRFEGEEDSMRCYCVMHHGQPLERADKDTPVPQVSAARMSSVSRWAA
jgi:hypothetical protein